MPNRLAHESSLGLGQHAGNPFDGSSWGEEAFRRAREEGKPVHVSVGYAACHWCHAMAPESFENPGWPLPVFQTRQGEPLFGGTCFPPEERYGRPGFSQVLLGLSAAWKARHPELHTQVERFLKSYRILDERLVGGAAQTGRGVPANSARPFAAFATEQTRHECSPPSIGRAITWPPQGSSINMSGPSAGNRFRKEVELASDALPTLVACGRAQRGAQHFGVAERLPRG